MPPVWIARLSVFGSVARGAAGEDSDVDLLYELRPGARLGWEIDDLADELSEIFGRRADLVARVALHPMLVETVLGEARPLMQRDILLLSEMVDAAEQARASSRGSARQRSVPTGCAETRSSGTSRGALGGHAASSETKARFPDIPWRNPARLRNRVVHGYWWVDIEILHTTAVEQLGAFARQLRDALAVLQHDT